MQDLPPRSNLLSGLRLPRRTARLRLTILNGGMCLVFGTVLLAVSYLLSWGALTLTAHAEPMATSSQSPASPSAQQEDQGQPQNGAPSRSPSTGPASTTDTWQNVSLDLLAFNAETERLIEALLTLASSEAGLGQRESLDLAVNTSAALAVPRPGISSLHLNVHADIQPAILDGDPLLVQQSSRRPRSTACSSRSSGSAPARPP